MVFFLLTLNSSCLCGSYFLFVGEEEGAHGVEVFDGLFVVCGVAEVLPVAVVGEADDFFAGCEEFFDEVGEVEVLAFGDVFEDARFEDVESHTDAVVDGGFFDVVGDLAAVVHFDDAEVDFDVALVHGDGADASIFVVELDELVDWDEGEDVAVGYEEGFGEVGDVGEGASGAEWGFFEGVLDVEVVLGAVLEEGAHEPCHVTDGDGDVVDAGCFHLVEQDLEDGFVANGHHWFGEDAGVGGEASAFAASEYD